MEYLDKLPNLLLSILTVDQWKALGFLLIIASAVTETVKRVFLLKSTSIHRKRVSYAVAFVTGLTAGIVGWALVGTSSVPDYYWLTFGVISGPLANFLHWLSLGVIGWKFPDLAAALKGKK